MKKFFLIIILFAGISSKAQVLNVPEVIQEQNQWCWAGVSKCMLDYYGYPQQQCDIAEYARGVITWTSFGTVDCCIDPNQGCNYWNYNWGYPGSIQDILIHFGNIQNYGLSSAISLNQVDTEITHNHPFVVRWGWNTGGGHFVVGHGVNDSDVYYMNPWFGEGLHVSTYNWLVSDGSHTWTHTNILTTAPTAISEIASRKENLIVFPNPSSGRIEIKGLSTHNNSTRVIIHNQLGQAVYTGELKNKTSRGSASMYLDNLHEGMYFLEVKEDDGVRIAKFVLE